MYRMGACDGDMGDCCAKLYQRPVVFVAFTRRITSLGVGDPSASQLDWKQRHRGQQPRARPAELWRGHFEENLECFSKGTSWLPKTLRPVCWEVAVQAGAQAGHRSGLLKYRLISEGLTARNSAFEGSPHTTKRMCASQGLPEDVRTFRKGGHLGICMGLE